jgi:hypothetical protein
MYEFDIEQETIGNHRYEALGAANQYIGQYHKRILTLLEVQALLLQPLGNYRKLSFVYFGRLFW